MVEMMRKILYYENILEFKENTNSTLELSEVKNLEFCRFCLGEDENDSDWKKMRIVGADGNLLNFQEMITTVTDLEFPEDNSPAKICKECLNKISTFYFFKIQVKRAHDVFNRLLQKLHEKGEKKESGSSEYCQIGITTTTTTISEADCCDSSENYEHLILEKYRKVNIDEIEEVYSLESDSAQEDDNTASTDVVASIAAEIEEELEEEEEEEKDENASLHHLEFTSTKPEIIQLGELSFDTNSEEIIETTITLSAEDVKKDGCVHILQHMDVEESLDDQESCECVEKPYSADTTHIELEQTSEENSNEEFRVIKEMPQVNEECSDDGSKKKVQRYSKPLLESLKCEICNAVFEIQRLLVDHVHQHHPFAKAFKCRECGNTFSHMQSLSRHMGTHKVKKLKNICNFCGKSFLRCDDFKRHIRIHTLERPYVCNVCEKGFKQWSELQAHVLTHDKEQKHFICSICNHRLYSRNGLYMHMKAHKGLKNFFCIHCDKRFLTNGELRSHAKVHRNIKLK